MTSPPLLKSNDRVGLIAPSRMILPDQVEKAIEIFESWGLQVNAGISLFETHGYFAGTDRQRLHDLQVFINDASIKCIFCARGGYGMTRILDQLDLKPLLKNPKWIVGFSDITALHLAINKLGIPSVHGLMPVQFEYFDAEGSTESLRKLLFEGTGEISAPHRPMNRSGIVKAPLIGGNLSLIVDSFGTKSEIDTVGKILLLEEIDEYLYKVDRMLTQLKRSGKLDELAGLVVGDFSQMKDTQIPFGLDVTRIIRDKVEEYDYPVGFGFPIGHEIPNYSISFMTSVHFNVSTESAILSL